MPAIPIDQNLVDEFLSYQLTNLNNQNPAVSAAAGMLFFHHHLLLLSIRFETTKAVFIVVPFLLGCEPPNKQRKRLIALLIHPTGILYITHTSGKYSIIRHGVMLLNL